MEVTEVKGVGSIFGQLSSWANRIKLKCFQCGHLFKEDRAVVEKFTQVQKDQGIETALQSCQNIVCPKCKSNRWLIETPKKFKLTFKVNLRPFFMALADNALWVIAWLEYRRMVMLKNWWFEYRSIITKGGAMVGLVALTYAVKQVFNVQFYEAGLAVAIFYAIIKFGKV